jgi:Condensation domain
MRPLNCSMMAFSAASRPNTIPAMAAVWFDAGAQAPGRRLLTIHHLAVDGLLAAWREALAGLEEATRLAPHDPGREPVAPEQMRLALSEPLTAALTAQARRHGLTLNTVIQTAWAILLGRLTGREDVVFGVTVAGRPPEVAGIENMVGLFINTLPLRVQLPPGTALLELLRQVQASQSRLMEHGGRESIC